jgi:FkbM family methyltransferase
MTFLPACVSVPLILRSISLLDERFVAPFILKKLQYRKRYVHWSEEELQIPILPGAVHSEGTREGEKVQPPPVFDLDFGRVSILTCFDINYPELWMHLSARGVDIVFWPSMYAAGELLRSIARVFHLHIISSVRLEHAPPQLVDLVGRTIIPEILNKDNAVDDWLAYIVTLDLSKQLMHADMLGVGQMSNLNNNLKKNEVTHLDEAEGWFIQSRWSKQMCRLPNTVRNSTQVAVCRDGGLKDFIRRSRDDINSRRGIQPSKFSQSQHRKMSKEALEMDRTVLYPSEFTKACADPSSDSICSILALLSSPMPDVNDAIPKKTERFEGLATEELSGTGGETIEELAVLSSDFPAHLLASQSEPHSFFPPPRTKDPQQEIGSGWEASFNVTVVLNPWHRPQLFQMQLKALHEQTFRISQIWVVLSASPKHSAFVDIMQSSCATWNMTCYHVNSDYNFVYYMPWQAALQATTRYVWFLDDDVLPGRHALAFLLHVSNTRPYRDALLGGRGSCVWPGLLSHPDFLIRRGSTYREGVEYCDAPAMRIIRESENLDGSRFMLQKHIKLLFREEPGNGMPDWRDNDGIQQGKWLSNDMQLTYVLRKYAGRRSFVLPCAGFPQMCIDGDSLLGKEGMTTVGSRVLIRREYIHRMFMRGADQVWTQRLRQARRRSVMVFAHSVAHAYTMARVRRELEKQGATHVYVTISGHTTQKGFGSVSPEDGVAEEELFKIFGFTEDDLLDQRVGFFSLKIGMDYPREHSPAATLADALFHFQEVLKSTRPSLVCLPLTRKHEVAPGTRRQMETESAAVRGAELAAEYTQVPVVWIISETSEDVVKAKVTAMEYNTLAEEAKTTAQQLKNGQSGDGKQSSTAVHGMNFSSSQSSVSAVSTNRPKKRWLLDIHDEVLKLCRSDPARYYLLDSSTSEKAAGCWRGSSQALQDLVLHYIFENIGATNKFYVEFGFDSDLREGGACGSNTFELSRSDWSGLLMDIQHENLSINLHREQVSAQNIIGLFSKYGVPHQPDYVSIDMDSSDLWVLRSVLSDFVKPRVVSVEYNPNFLFSSTLTFPDPSWGSPALFGNLTSIRDNRQTCFYGASVGAIRLVAQEFGYQLVHRDHHCDLFLIRSDLVEGDDACPWGEGSFKQTSRCSLAEAERVNMNAAPNRKCPEQRHMELEDAVLLVDYQVWSTTFSPALAMQAAWKSIWTEYIGTENGACFKKVYEAYGGRRPIDPIPSWPGCNIHAGLFAFCNKPVMGLDDHPPVAIAFGEIPLVSTRVGTMTLNFHLVGTVVGLRYRIVVQEIHLLTGSVKQQDESMVYASDVSVELGLYDDLQDKFRFAISAFDAHDELVARKDVSFPHVVTVLPRREYAVECNYKAKISTSFLDVSPTICTHDPDQDWISWTLQQNHGTYGTIEDMGVVCASGLIECASDRTFVDCGAAMGHLTILAASLGMTAHAIEPVGVNVRLLQESVRENDLGNLVIIHQAEIVSNRVERDKTQTFPTVPGNFAASSINSVKMGELGVQNIKDTASSTVGLVTLPGLIHTQNIELLALNCQGCEYDALLSLGRRLFDIRGVLLYVQFKSMFRCTARHAESQLAVHLLEQAGFCFYDILDIEAAVIGNRQLQPIPDMYVWQERVTWGRTSHRSNFSVFAYRDCGQISAINSRKLAQAKEDTEQEYAEEPAIITPRL